MSYLVLKTGESNSVLPTRVYHDPQAAQAVLQPLRWKMLTALAKQEYCAKDLAGMFGTSEQVISYHMHELERTDLITLERTEKRRGATAKYYRSKLKAVTFVPDSQLANSANSTVALSSMLERCGRVLDPFISKARFDGYIVVGSPDSHGIFRARARDAHLAADVAMFFGSLLPVTRDSTIRLDTEVAQADIAKSLILIGGPRVNTLTMMVNEWLPVTYELTGQNMMISRITGRTYTGEDEGAIEMIPNPLNQDERALVIAGNSSLGTHAAVIAFVKHTEKIAEGNSSNRNIIARVVSGVDQDSNGIIDDAEFLE